MRRNSIRSYWARRPNAARLLLILLFSAAIFLFLFFEGEYLLSLRRASLLILPQDVPIVRLMPDYENEKMDINSATAEELQSVPGIGPVTAQSILSLREERNGFYFMEELLDVPGVGEKRLEALKEVFFCTPPGSLP